MINCSIPFLNILYENGYVANLKSSVHTTYIYGHKNPDADAICSSIVLADYLKNTGNNNTLVPCRLGKLNKETQYIINFFNVDSPLLINDLSGADDVILVDHNSPSQSLDFKNANIIGLIDHHAITGFETKDPIKVIIEPVGCTCTILYKLYKNNNISISYKMAGLMLSAIISDTLLLKSPITTQDDITAVKELSAYTGVDYQNYGFKMLLEGTNVKDLSEKDIITFDSKSYTVNGYKIEISFVNIVDISEILFRKEKILEEINKFIDENKIQLFVLTIVDIIDMDSTILVSGSITNVVEKAFNVKILDNEAFLKGISSRKKQVYPYISKAISELPEYISSNGYKKIEVNLSYIFLTLLFLLI